jgi:hypothetical protein
MKMRAGGIGLSIVAAVFFFAAPLSAQDMCSELWIERNQIYKDAGYCFKTARAIRAFGNAGCSYDDVRSVPLTTQEQRRINEIVRMERSYNCAR